MTDNDNGKGLSVSFFRIIVFIYTEQFPNVRWNNQISSIFTLKNDYRQVAVLSAIAYCFYEPVQYSEEEDIRLLDQQRLFGTF